MTEIHHSTKKSKGENECRRILEARYKCQFRSIRPNWLPSPHLTKKGKRRKLEIDCYNPMKPGLAYNDPSPIGLGVEYDGIQHREPGHFNMTDEDFALAKERDDHKDDLCAKLGITLIRITDEIKLDQIESHLTKLLDEYDRAQRKKNRFCIIC